MYHLHDARPGQAQSASMRRRAELPRDHRRAAITCRLLSAGERAPGCALLPRGHRNRRDPARWGWPYQHRHGHPAALKIVSERRAKIGLGDALSPAQVPAPATAPGRLGVSRPPIRGRTGPWEEGSRRNGRRRRAGLHRDSPRSAPAWRRCPAVRCSSRRVWIAENRLDSASGAASLQLRRLILERIRVIHGRSPLWVAVLG